MSKLKKVIAVVALALAAVLVFLYAFEYFDFVFIDRPENNDTPETTVGTTEPPETTESTTAPQTTEPPVTVPPVTTEPEPIIDPETFLDADAAGAEGYYLTDQPYTEGMILAELRQKLETTDEFTLRTRNWNKATYKYEHQNSEAELVWTPTAEDIPALEAYMGYIFADGGDTMYIYDSYGRHLNYFNPGAYEFAYKRDKLGNPLLRRAHTYTASTKDGSESADFKEFDYFYLNAAGEVCKSGYFDPAENRGVMADYPGYFGTTEGSLERKCVFNRVVQKTVKGKLKTFFRTRWSIMWNDEPINDTVYYALYPYSEGYACVTDEEGIMYFVDQNGKRTFETKKEYVEPGGRYVVDRLLLPLDETTALGCYYYDHGLVKARRQIYDYYQLEDWDIMYVMSDEYVMLYTDGTEFPTPANYTVKTYSDGVILMEKNGTYGYMDYTGAWLNTPDYEDAKYFSEGLAACKKDGRWGVIDTKGNTVLPFVYDYIQPTSSGVIITHSANGWNVYLKMAK